MIQVKWMYLAGIGELYIVYNQRVSLDGVSTLVQIKLLHTAIWFFFASCILVLPIAGMLRRFRLAAGLTLLVLVECMVLAVNHSRCPLTNLAARYAADRAPNFDIYLPIWLSRNNHYIFGTLFVAGGLFVLWKRMSSR
jgi:hypothetical protein